jgi:hypothetical protein
VCNSGYACKWTSYGYHCGVKECNSGALKCDSNYEWSCNSSTFTWQRGNYCESGCSGSYCKKVCSPYSVACDGNYAIKTCNSTGTQYSSRSCQSGTTCGYNYSSNTYYCKPNPTNTPTPTPVAKCDGSYAIGSRKCNSGYTAIQVCEKDNYGRGTWQTATTCTGGKCVSEYGGTVLCKTNTPTPVPCGNSGQKCCSGNTCKLSTLSCMAQSGENYCVTKSTECTSGQTKCMSGYQYNCSNGAFVKSNYCSGGCNASGLKCNTGVCTAGAKRCSGTSAIETCNSTGTAWSASSCPNGVCKTEVIGGMTIVSCKTNTPVPTAKSTCIVAGKSCTSGYCCAGSYCDSSRICKNSATTSTPTITPTITCDNKPVNYKECAAGSSKYNICNSSGKWGSVDCPNCQNSGNGTVSCGGSSVLPTTAPAYLPWDQILRMLR